MLVASASRMPCCACHAPSWGDALKRQHRRWITTSKTTAALPAFPPIEPALLPRCRLRVSASVAAVSRNASLTSVRLLSVTARLVSDACSASRSASQRATATLLRLFGAALPLPATEPLLEPAGASLIVGRHLVNSGACLYAISSVSRSTMRPSGSLRHCTHSTGVFSL